MDALSKALTRIRDEILTLREERERLLSGLQLHTVDRKRVVSRMLARFSNDLAEIARRRRQVRMVILTDLKQTVLRLRQETRESLGGVREAFWSLGSAAPSAAARVAQTARRELSPRRGTPAMEHGQDGTRSGVAAARSASADAGLKAFATNTGSEP